MTSIPWSTSFLHCLSLYSHGCLQVIETTVHSSVLLRYPVLYDLHALMGWGGSGGWGGDVGSGRETRCVSLPIRAASHVDPLWVQARSERVVEDPQVTRHRVGGHGALQRAGEGNWMLTRQQQTINLKQYTECKSIHPSIVYAHHFEGHTGAGANPNWHWARIVART